MKIKTLYSSLLCFLMGAVGLHAQLFSEQAKAMGINHHHYDPNVMGGGIAVFDFNNDGFDDIYFTGGLNDDKLYENMGDGTFTDVTKKMRITAFSIVKTMGVVAGDIDNDGFTDLLVTTAENERCYLLKNEGGKFFKDISKAAGINHKAWSTTATMADYDNDGDLDIYVGNYVSYNALPFDANITDAEEDFFYQNNGNSTFTKLKNPLSYEKRGCTLVASFSDFDQDGDSDLFVLNDFGDFYQSNKLLLNNTTSNTFEEITDPSGMNAEINSMGIAIGDFNEDGNFDYYITNIGDNLLYEGLGNAKFKNISDAQAVNDGTGVSWGTAFIDINNDSHLDLYVAKGTLLSIDDPQENKLYLRNSENGIFEDVSETQHMNEPNKARGMAYGDFNNDGSIDLVVSNIRVIPENKGNALVYINQNTNENNWAKFSLKGTLNNKSAYGALVKVYANNKQQIREISGGASYLSHHSSTAHFGLSNTDKIDSVVVQWPGNATKEVYRNLPVNTHYSIIEKGSIYTTTTQRMEICANEEVFLEGAMRNTDGIYTDIISGANEEIDTLKITRLVIKNATASECEITVVNEPENLPLSIYPIPFKSKIRINGDIELSENVQVIISDISGCVIKNDSIAIDDNADFIELDNLENLPSGIYIIRLISNGKSYTRKLAKE